MDGLSMGCSIGLTTETTEGVDSKNGWVGSLVDGGAVAGWKMEGNFDLTFVLDGGGVLVSHSSSSKGLDDDGELDTGTAVSVFAFASVTVVASSGAMVPCSSRTTEALLRLEEDFSLFLDATFTTTATVNTDVTTNKEAMATMTTRRCLTIIYSYSVR